jgi:hypothetical protein
MKPVLIYMRPLDQKTGARVDVRVADAPTADAFGTAGYVWEPAVATRPKLSIELMSREMDGKVQAGQATFSLALGEVLSVKRAATLYWKGAGVVIHSTGVLEGASAIPDFWGYVTSANLDLDTGRLNVTAEVSTALIERPLLTREFTGGGGIGGDAAMRGVLWPAGFGSVNNVPILWFDRVRNIGAIDGYGNTLAINWLGEGRSGFGARVADYASYAFLAAAIDNKTIKPGQWGTCVAEGLVAVGAPPTGTITVDAVFGFNRIGAMMKRVLSRHAEVPAERIDAAAFDILDQIVPLPVHFWTDQQRSTKDLLEALAQSCNATPLVSFQNMVTVTRGVGGAIVGTLDRSGSIEPRVLDWQSADVDPPYYLLKARAARPALVMSDDQINYVDTLEDKGLYDASVVYRSGNLVWLSDGSQWLYQNTTPAAGHAPPSMAAPDGNGFVQDAWWFRRQPPKTSDTFTYRDGTPLEALKPGQAGADVTANNTADGIKGQGLGATAPAADIFNSYLKLLENGQLQGGGGGTVTYGGLGGGALGLLANLFFGNNLLLESAGGAIASLNAFKTSLGTADSFRGQGLLATLSSLANGGPYLSGFSALSALDRIVIGTSGPGGIVDAGNSRWLGNIDLITSQGSADSFRGQTVFATLASGTSLDSTVFGMPGRLAGSPQHGLAYLQAGVVAFAEGDTIQGLKPQEAGANVTENRSADSFRGQGKLATLSQVILGKETITRADGTTIVTEILIVTELGSADSFKGQGKGATANNLTDLDKDAADKLAGLGNGGGGSQTVGIAVPVTKALAPGASASLYLNVFMEAGSGGGTLLAKIYGGPSGQTGLLAQGPGRYLPPGEAGSDSASFTYTNSTSITQSYTFYGDYTGGGGGDLRERLSYFTVS